VIDEGTERFGTSATAQENLPVSSSIKVTEDVRAVTWLVITNHWDALV